MTLAAATLVASVLAGVPAFEPPIDIAFPTRHFPTQPAVADFDWRPKVTVTFSPMAARPHTGTGLSRWSTAWSVKSGASVTSARTSAGTAK